MAIGQLTSKIAVLANDTLLTDWPETIRKKYFILLNGFERTTPFLPMPNITQNVEFI